MKRLILLLAAVVMVATACKNNKKHLYSNEFKIPAAADSVAYLSGGTEIHYSPKNHSGVTIHIAQVKKVVVYWIVGDVDNPDLKIDTLHTVDPHDVPAGKRLEKIAYIDIDTDLDGTTDETRRFYWGGQKINDLIMLPSGNVIKIH